ncbi:MAG: MFS transporter, partial [Afipia sp.]
MLGNFITGVSILAPAGMLPELAQEFGVSIHEAGLLITFGAVVLCIGSPVSAWLTSTFDRRTLLSVTVAIIAAAQFASMVAPNYATLMAIRLIMLAVAALFTPQAAGTAAMMVPPERRGSTMSYVFLGWSLALAVGLPLIAYVASHIGWR